MKMTGHGRENLTGKVNTELTDEINYYYSQALNHAALKNLNQGHQFEDKEQGLRMEWLNTKVGYTNYGADAKVTARPPPRALSQPSTSQCLVLRRGAPRWSHTDCER